MSRPSFRVVALLLAAAGVALALPAAAQWGENGEPLDPGFPENGFSIPAGYSGECHRCGPGEVWSARHDFGLSAWGPPTWLPHRGNRQYLHIAEKKGQPLQMFRVMDENGRPLAGVTVEMQQAGYEVPGVRGRTDESGAFYVTVTKPERSHRVRFSLPDYRPVVLEMSGGRLETARHEIVLEDGSTFEEASVFAYVPDERTAPPSEVLDSYRRGLRALSRDRYERAARELRLAVERWPLPSLEGEAGNGYRPYEALEAALEGLGAEQLAADWRERGAQREAALVEGGS